MSVGKRQHAPRKRGAAFMINEKRGTENTKAEDKENATKAAEAAAGEEVDPDEPRYCLCGDVSYGDMVACENDRVGFPPRLCGWISLRSMLTYLTVRTGVVSLRVRGLDGVSPTKAEMVLS